MKSSIFRNTWSFPAILLLVILCLVVIYFVEPGKTKQVNITYIANEGFLIQIGEKRMVVDGFFGEKALDFCATPTQEALAQMTSASGLFSDVDLIAVTHNHVDHFYAPLVAEHLRANEHARFVSCARSVEALASQEGYASFQDRVLEITPDSLCYQDTLINGIGVRVYRLAHGPYLETDPETGLTVNRHRMVQNLGFVFQVDGVKVFHCGDSGPRCWDDYEHFRLDREDIDIAMLGRGFLASEVGFGIEIIRDFIKPGHIVLMHIHPDSNPHYNQVAVQVREEFPSITIFENQMDSRQFLIP